MIEALSASTGLIVGDPRFWIPLVFFFVLLMLMAGIVAFAGFDIGWCLLMSWLPELERKRVIDCLTNWRGANASWVLLFFAVFMPVYPMGWSSIFEQQFVPVLLLTVGCALRSLAFEFRARAPMKQQPFWNGLFSAGAYASASGLALWLARTVNGNLNLH